MKNVLVVGVGGPLGRALLEHLQAREGVEQLVGIEPTTSSDWVDGAELVPFPSDHQDFVRLLNEYPIDTVIHCGLAPDRGGHVTTPSEARVIDTMQLGAALASSEVSVRAWVIASSSSIYPVSSQGPLLHRESGEIDSGEGTLGASIREAEDYARDIALRRPHLDVAILRLQQLAGESVRGPMSALLAQPILPNPIGFDAPIQLLAVEDAVRALAFAAEMELAGVYNVASTGTIRMSEAIRILEKPSLPVLPFETRGALAGLARRLGVPHIPEGMLDALRFGHALDTGKLTAAGFEPETDQATCLAALRVARTIHEARSEDVERRGAEKLLAVTPSREH